MDGETLVNDNAVQFGELRMCTIERNFLQAKFL